MSRDGSISFVWGDKRHRFRLALGGLRELQETCGASPFEIHRRLATFTAMADDAREVLRLGLIGGGDVTPPAALKLVESYVDARPLSESLGPAAVVLGAALYGVPDEPPGKPDGAAEAPRSSPPTDD